MARSCSKKMGWMKRELVMKRDFGVMEEDVERKKADGWRRAFKLDEIEFCSWNWNSRKAPGPAQIPLPVQTRLLDLGKELLPPF